MTDRSELEKVAREFFEVAPSESLVPSARMHVTNILTPDTILRLASEVLTEDERRWLRSAEASEDVLRGPANVSSDWVLPNLRILAGEETDHE